MVRRIAIKVFLIVFCCLLIMNLFRFMYSVEDLTTTILLDDFMDFISYAPDSSGILNSMLANLDNAFTTGNSTLDSFLSFFKVPVQLIMMVVTGLIQIGMYIGYIFKFVINF